MFKELNMLSPFLLDSSRELSVREYARTVRVAPATASTLLKRFKKMNLVTATKSRNLLLYHANESNTIFKETKRYFHLLAIQKSGLINYLIKTFNEPIAIILFGSYAKAENGPSSDIDIFVLTTNKPSCALAPYEKILGTTIQLIVHTPSDITQKKINKHLLNNIINGIKLHGFLEAY